MSPEHLRLFTPGPVEVDPEILNACCRPMIGHRTPEFSELYREVQEGLEWLLHPDGPVFLVTGSATLVWEIGARNLVSKGCLHLTNGAFSERWALTTTGCQKEMGKLSAEWGKANHDLDAIRAELDTGRYDALAMVHSETSTGVLNPIVEIAAVVREYPDVLFLVDAVSSVTTLPLDLKELGVDLLLAGVQKGFALPPGIAIAAVSQAALARAETVEGRGYYSDLLAFRKYHQKAQTPTTPVISLIYALQAQLQRMRAEGLDARYARHAAMAERTRAWARDHGFELFTEPGYEAAGLTCLSNTREIDVPALAKALASEHHARMDQGYGKLKTKAFRIPHMGDMTMETLETYLGWIDAWMREHAA